MQEIAPVAQQPYVLKSYVEAARQCFLGERHYVWRDHDIV